MDNGERRDDIGKYRVVEKGDSLIATKSKSTSCFLGCLAVVVLPLVSYIVLLVSALLGGLSQQAGMLALSLLVFSLGVVLFGLFFGYGRKPILEFKRQADEVVFKGKKLGRISDLVEIVIEYRQVTFRYGTNKVERDQYLILLEPLSKSIPVAFFVKTDPAERMARIFSNFSGVPFRHKASDPQTFDTDDGDEIDDLPKNDGSK